MNRKRPREVENLFNPAFCSLVLRKGVADYTKVRRSGIPFELSFLILPLVLHGQTRRSLPSSSRTTLRSWLQEYSHLQIGMSTRIRNMVDITREAILFGCNQGVLVFSEDGNQLFPNGKKGTPSWARDSECSDCLKKAAFLGRWIAKSEPEQVFIMFGVTP